MGQYCRVFSAWSDSLYVACIGDPFIYSLAHLFSVTVHITRSLYFGEGGDGGRSGSSSSSSRGSLVVVVVIVRSSGSCTFCSCSSTVEREEAIVVI